MTRGKHIPWWKRLFLSDEAIEIECVQSDIVAAKRKMEESKTEIAHLEDRLAILKRGKHR